MTDLAIIIVNWNVRDLLAGCLRSVEADLARSRLAAQVWVVDNASTDGSVEMLRRDFPQVKLIASPRNLGFAAGNNAALRALGFDASAPEANLPALALLLNPDTVVQPGALATLVEFMQATPAAGLVGPRLEFGDGSFQHGAFGLPGLWQLAIELLPLPGRLVESRLNGRYPRALYQAGQPFRVGHPLGAAIGVRGDALRQVGLLDEQFHMYAEEVDWAKRLTAAGWQAYCVPAAVVTHFGGQSTGQIHAASFINLWASRYKFYYKHYSRLKVWLATRLVQAGMARRARQDTRQAAQGSLSTTNLTERLRCYEQVAQIWQGREPDA